MVSVIIRMKMEFGVVNATKPKFLYTHNYFNRSVIWYRFLSLGSLVVCVCHSPFKVEIERGGEIDGVNVSVITTKKAPRRMCLLLEKLMDCVSVSLEIKDVRSRVNSSTHTQTHTLADQFQSTHKNLYIRWLIVVWKAVCDRGLTISTIVLCCAVQLSSIHRRIRLSSVMEREWEWERNATTKIVS